MKRGRSTCNPTKTESMWIGATKRNGCLCCISMGYAHDRDGYMVEAHHLLEGGIRRGHFYTVGLCMWHHRARVYVSGWTHETHRRMLGPSLDEGSDIFHARFGLDDDLLRAQIALNERHGLRIAHPYLEELNGPPPVSEEAA